MHRTGPEEVDIYRSVVDSGIGRDDAIREMLCAMTRLAGGHDITYVVWPMQMEQQYSAILFASNRKKMCSFTVEANFVWAATGRQRAGVGTAPVSKRVFGHTMLSTVNLDSCTNLWKISLSRTARLVPVGIASFDRVYYI